MKPRKKARQENERADYWDSLARIIMETVELRHANTVSQSDLAAQMSTTQSVISRFENLGRLPSYDFIARLSIALGHCPGITLCGDYMAVVPLAKQALVKRRAEQIGVSTQVFVEQLIERALVPYEPRELKLRDFANAAQGLDRADDRRLSQGLVEQGEGTKHRAEFAKAV